MDKFLKKIGWFFIFLPSVYLAITWNSLPERIAMHFNLHGDADKYGDKNEFLVFIAVMLVVSAGVFLLLTNIYRIDPKKYAADNKERLGKIALAVVIVLCAVECFIVYVASQGGLKLNIHFMFALIGAFWAVIGNYMNNMRPNYFVGFRLPWTLESEENWRYTHHIAGRLWFVGGILIAIISIFGSTNASIIALGSISLVITTVPIVCSHIFYRKQKASRSIK
jgi:uncharacterized membrane protein